MGRYKDEPKEQSRKTKQNSPDVKSWLASKDTIALQPSTIAQLKELTTSEPKIWNNTYDEVILMLIRTYRQTQKSAQ